MTSGQPLIQLIPQGHGLLIAIEIGDIHIGNVKPMSKDLMIHFCMKKREPRSPDPRTTRGRHQRPDDPSFLSPQRYMNTLIAMPLIRPDRTPLIGAEIAHPERHLCGHRAIAFGIGMDAISACKKMRLSPQNGAQILKVQSRIVHLIANPA